MTAAIVLCFLAGIAAVHAAGRFFGDVWKDRVLITVGLVSLGIDIAAKAWLPALLSVGGIAGFYWLLQRHKVAS